QRAVGPDGGKPRSRSDPEQLAGRAGSGRRPDAPVARPASPARGQLAGRPAQRSRPWRGCEAPALLPECGRYGLLPSRLGGRGAVSNMLPVYREADALVLTSDYEGTPNVVLEAMACGLPVIATRVGDVPEIVRHGETGFLVEPSDTEAIAERLVDMLRDRALC